MLQYIAIDKNSHRGIVCSLAEYIKTYSHMKMSYFTFDNFIASLLWRYDV